MAIPDELPDIRLYFSGILELCLRDGAENCQIGILADVPMHVLTFDIKEIVDGVKRPMKCSEKFGGCFDPSLITKEMSLSVEGVVPGIRLHKPNPDFHRDEQADDLNDFRWLIDFEGGEGFGKQLNINRRAYRTILTINSGEFFTANLSENKVKFVRGAETKPLGKVALMIGANIDLGASGAKAVLRHGEDVVCEFRRTPGVNYEITVGINPPAPHFTMHDQNDFLFHYLAVGFDLDHSERLELKLDVPSNADMSDFRNSPDARCTGIGLSKSQSLG